MRIARLIVVGGLLLAGSSAEAGWFGFGSKQPKPINVLTISRPYDPSHTHRSLSDNKYNKVGWGARWKLLFRTNPYHVHPYIRGY